MAKAKKKAPRKGFLEPAIEAMAEKMAHYSLMSYHIAQTMLEDYVEVVAKLEGIDGEEVHQRIWEKIHDNLQEDELALDVKETPQGDKPFLKMLFRGMAIPVIPRPLLHMPLEPEPVKRQLRELLKQEKKKQ